MNSITKITLGTMLAFSPLLVGAQTTTVTLPVPFHITPVSNITLATTTPTFDWSDTFYGTSSLFYTYESSLATSSAIDGTFSIPSYISSLLASSTITRAGMVDGLHHWHVRSVDIFGNISAWSPTAKVVLDTTTPTIPGTPLVITSTPPITTTSSTATTTTIAIIANGSQTWSFATSTDNLSGIASYEYSINSSTTWVSNLLSTTIITNLGIGTHTLSIRAIDGIGNKSPLATGSIVITVTSVTATTTPTIPPVLPPFYGNLKEKRQCLRGGWRNFTAHRFKNQGKCISYAEKVEKQIKDQIKKQKKELELRKKQEDDNRRKSKERNSHKERDSEHESNNHSNNKKGRGWNS